MEKLIEMLEDLNPDVDFSTEEKLIDGGLLDSMAILSLVSDLEDEFDVEITPVELVPANFNSAAAMWNMVPGAFRRINLSGMKVSIDRQGKLDHELQFHSLYLYVSSCRNSAVWNHAAAPSVESSARR